MVQIVSVECYARIEKELDSRSCPAAVQAVQREEFP